MVAGEKKEDSQKGEEGEKKEENLTRKIFPLPKGVRIKEVNVESTQFPSDFPTIEFYLNGGSNGGEITLNSEDHQGYTIKINFLTGVVVVEKTQDLVS